MNYDIIQKPPRGRSEESEYYITPVYRDTMEVEEMAKNINNVSSFSVPDLVGLISAITQQITTALKSGRKVKIDGLGTFRLRLTTPKKDLQATDKVAKKIEVRDVAFRPERKLINEFADVTFERTNHSRTLRRVVGREELIEKLRTFFDENEFLHREDVETLAHCSSATAKKRLRELVDEGYIVNVGLRLAPAYRATDLLS